LNGGAQVVQDELSRLSIQINRASGRQEWKVRLDLFPHVPAPTVEDRTEALVEPELTAVLPYQVDDSKVALAAGSPESSTKLLREDSRRLCWPQEEQAVSVGNVYSLAEHLDREQATETPAFEFREAFRSFRWGVVGRECHAREARVTELPSHVSRVLLGYAEAQRTHRGQVENNPPERLEQLRDASIVVREDVAELIVDIATSPPRDLSEVGPIGHSEILEGHQEPKVDRLPEAKLDGDPVIEPFRHVLAVEPLGCRGKAEQLLGLKVAQKAVVSRRRSMMKLINYDDVKRAGSDPFEACLGQ
jgi:hypothetical protein